MWFALYTISVQSFTPSHLGSTWSNVAIGPKVSGQATAVDQTGRVLAFGGLTDGAGSPCTSDVWAYKSSTWSKLDATGGPGPRMYAASAILDNSLYCFGGWDPEAPGTGGTFKDEAWKLDLATNDWSMLEPLPCGAVSRHTACTVGDKVIVHTFRGVTVYDKDGMREQPTTGDSPDGLSMCTATALGDDAMLLIFGSTKQQGMSSDAYVLDTTSWAWKKLKNTGEEGVPSARASSAAAPIDGTSCLVFGGAGLGGGGYEGGAGLTAFDETWKLTVNGDDAIWEKLVIDGPPKPRVAASLSALPGSNGEFLLHGGWTPSTKETYDESAMLKLA